MKKIIAALLILCCMFSVVSCNMLGGNGDGDDGLGNIDEATAAQIDNILGMFDDSIPTKAETRTTETVGNVIIESSAYLVTGTVGGKKASVYYGNYQSLSEIGNTFDMVNRAPESKWYIEGQGVSIDKGVTWDATAGDFAPTEGFIKVVLNKSKIKEAEYNEATSTLKVTIAKEYATEVVAAYLEKGQTIDSDITITIVTAGGRVNGLKLEYYIPAHEISVPDSDAKIPVQQTDIVVDAKYSYDIQTITLE
jgi:hypothetical protein